jgi:hypothetical protein
VRPEIVAPANRNTQKWRLIRDSHPGLDFISTWIEIDEENEPPVTDTAFYRDLWIRCTKESSMADVTLFYIAKDDSPQKGAFVETGCALSNGRQVFLVRDDAVLDSALSDARFHPNCNREVFV